ncbi:hypothetical protein SARC_02690 [Sphaeroforma arctica JP610]|uniref:Uncharacterized protein n=1 Tax=Sphaeroforma arctica JP610 TaxID=667725 RepID=A0A0L0G7Z2_9EUKA|nr:hypothetical protein SARC_02690 [Sphaeroforma arctica JP610]KNC85100.1 hypothetical protein SARC_02690 [Sphaeroforma arctica JP610]|eukprot:XP_014159002.1 hypothetical protein SARC_02690 [Sphaeroforma arctica JP610]
MIFLNLVHSNSPPNVPDFIDFVTQQTMNLRNCLPPLDEDDSLPMHKLVKAQSLQNVQQAPPGDATYKMHRGRGGGNPGKVRAHWPMSSQNFPQIDFPPNAKVRQVLAKQRNIAAQPNDHREYMIPVRSPHTRSPYATTLERTPQLSQQSDKNAVYSPHPNGGPMVTNKGGASGPYPSRGIRYQPAPNTAPMGGVAYREQYSGPQHKAQQPPQQSVQNGHGGLHAHAKQLGRTGSSDQLNNAHSGRNGARNDYYDSRTNQDFSETDTQGERQPTMGVVVNVYPKGDLDPDGESTGVIPKIWDALHLADILNGLEKFSGRPAADYEIDLVHKNELLDTPDHSEEKYEAITAAGCVLEMAYRIIENSFMCGAAVVRPSGHLIAPDNDESVYRLNNVAIAAANCVERGHFQRVAILNWAPSTNAGRALATGILTMISLREYLRLDEHDLHEESAPPVRSHRELDQRVESAAQALAELSFARGVAQPTNTGSPQIAPQQHNGPPHNSQQQHTQHDAYGNDGPRQHPQYAPQQQPQPQAQHRHQHAPQQRMSGAPHDHMYPQDAYTHAPALAHSHKHNQSISAKPQRQLSQPIPGERNRYQPSPKMKGVNREHIERDRPYHGSSSHLHAGSHAYQPYDHPSHPLRSRSPDPIKKKKAPPK